MLHSPAKLKSSHLIRSMNFAAIISSEPGCIPVSLEKNTAHPEAKLQYLHQSFY